MTTAASGVARLELPRTSPVTSEMQRVVQDYQQCFKDDPEVSSAVAAIRALTNAIAKSTASTMMELERDLRRAADCLKDNQPASLQLSSGCELFLRFVTRTSFVFSDFDACKTRLIDRGSWFADKAAESRAMVAALGDRFVQDGGTVLTLGYSRVVLPILLRAAKHQKNFSVVVTEARPHGAGYQAARVLHAAGVPVTVVMDSAVGYVMERIDLVIAGADAVVENGGIVSRIGSFSTAIVAQAHRVPFYVAAESYKFTRLFPLNQQDLPLHQRQNPPFPLLPGLKTNSDGKGNDLPDGVTIENPSHDYTPPQYLTLLITDLGILTPSAVSDELIKLYA